MLELRQPFTKPCLLVVEGSDDRAFFQQLAKHLAPEYPQTSDLQIETIGGKTNLGEYLETLPAIPGFLRVAGFRGVQSLGVVLDADNDPVGTFHQAQDALRNAGLPVPKEVEKPSETERIPRTSIYTIPGRNQAGTLEDLCFVAMPDNFIKNCIQDHFKCLKEHDRAPRKLAKATFQMYLASIHDDHDRRVLETAVKASDWPWQHPAFEGIKQFLLQVVGD